jgi:hypothetical protein
MRPNFRQPKRRGEWAEIKFMLRATECGLTVYKPYGDSARFDFVVGSRGPQYRVQVRSTRIFTNSRAYVTRFTWGDPPRRYSRLDFDFIAVYVVPCDIWYVIPISAIRPAPLYLCLYPHIRRSRGRFERFREAWSLLKQPQTQRRRRGACVAQDGRKVVTRSGTG